MSRLYNMLSSARRRSSGTDEYWDQVVLQIHADTVTGEGGDSAYANAVLHMPMDGADNSTSFTDLKGKTIAVNGQSKMVTATKYFGTSSAYFDGTGDYLQPTAGSDFNFGTGDFCLEAWVYPTRVGVQQPIFSFATESAGRVNFELTAANKFDVEMYGVGVMVTNNTTISVNTWYHVAFTRNGNTWKVFVDGNDTGTSYGSSQNITHNDFVIGGGSYTGSMNRFFQGYIDDVIIYKGIPKYTSNFTKPVSANPTFGLTYNDAKGHSIFGGGSAVLSTTQKKFGSKSLYLDGTGDYLQLDGSNDFVFSTGDFTIEMWIFPTRLTGVQVLYDPRTAEGVYPCIYLSGAGLYYYVSSADRISATTSLTLSAWHHIALSRSNGSTRLFLNGIQQGITYVDTNNYLNGANRPLIGTSYSAIYSFQGYIDDIRVTKGVGRYTSSFGSSLDPYYQYNTFLVNFESEYPTADQYASDVVLHLPMESTNDATVFVDLKGNTITRNGSVYQTTAKYKYRKSSAYFDGNGDYLVTPGMWNLDTALYTIEFWVNYAGTKDGRALMFGTNSQTTGYQISFNTNGSVYAAVPNGGPREAYTAGGVITANTWHHIAVVLMASPRTLIFVDGVKKADNSTAGTLNLPDTMTLTIGADPSYSQTTLAFEGYIEDLRITKNVNRYTADFSPPTSPLLSVPYIKDKVKDRPLSVMGNASLSSAEKKFGSYSAYFDGTGDYLKIPDSSDFNLSSGAFTIELWVYRLNNSYIAYISKDTYGSNYFWGIAGADTYLSIGTNGATAADTYAMPANLVSSQWHHIAMSGTGSIVYVYVNGGLIGVLPRTLTNATADVTIGCHAHNSPNSFLHGYIDDLRITKGVARYTDTFATNSDQYYSNVVLHMPMEGLDGYADFMDLRGKAVTVVGNTNTVTATKKFGTSSAYFDGTGDYLTLVDSTDWHFGSGDFTIEAWVRLDASPNTWGNIVSHRINSSTNNSFTFFIQTNGTLSFDYSTSGSASSGSAGKTGLTFGTGTWHHVACVRSGASLTVYVDGVGGSVHNISTNALFNSTTILRVGIDGNEGTDTSFKGYIDDLRITKGVARYTANFTPPTAPHPVPNFAVPTASLPIPDFPYGSFTQVAPDSGQLVDPYWSNVVLGLHMDGLNAGTVFHDEKGKTVAANGNANTVTATKKFGNSSAYFDGTGDYLSTPHSTDFNFGNGDFTIEFWMYPTAVPNASQYWGLVSKRGAYNSNNEWGCFITGVDEGYFGFEYGTTGIDNIGAGQLYTPWTGSWKHIAIVRTGGYISMFMEGNLLGTPHSVGTTQFYNGTHALFVGRIGDAAGQEFPGYIDDLRITKGVARYTANFTPPTRAFPRS